MATLSLVAAARRDIKAILEYLADQRGFGSASNFSAALTALQQRLSMFPQAYAVRPALGPTIRTAVVAPYVVVYQHAEDTNRVTILRVIHGRRDVAAELMKTR